jgi:6-phosphogluconolactonase (cycloisomerase 2 family)
MRTKHFTLAALAALALAGCSDSKVLEPNAGADLARSETGGDNKINLNRGAVFSMSNAIGGNTVVAFSRAPDGTLTEAGRFPTGGNGSGGFEDTANGLVLGSAQGESAPNNLTGDHELLFATNAGSNSITVFRVEKDGLEIVEVQPSGGEKPVSITVNRGLVYVLHSGETTDGEIAIPNCTTGNLPSVTGFRIDNQGQLTPIPNSTRLLSGDQRSGCAQVSFNPTGTVLVVTERLAGDEDPTGPAGDEGVINTFVVNHDGTLGTHRVLDATGQGPFGFTFNKQGALLTAEQFDGPMGPGEGAAAGYTVHSDGTLTPTSPSVKNGGTDTCWFVVTDSGKYGFTTSFFPDTRISSYLVRPDGGLTLLNATANTVNVETGASDMALSRNSKYLYQLNSFQGTINVFAVGNDGSLTFVQRVNAHAPSATAAPIGIAAS